MSGYAKPIWRISVADEDITARLEPRLMQLNLTDNRGMEADQLDVTLDDSDGRLDIPTRGAKIALALGWKDSGLVDKGVFTVDEIEHSGTPDQLTIRARSADLRSGLSTKKERSWHQTTVGAIVEKIAEEAGLIPVVSPDLARQSIKHLDQTSESDANLLTRLGKMFDAAATVKAGRLLFFKIGRGQSAGGEMLPTVVLTRQKGDRHRFSVADRDACAAVKACYYDTQAGKKGEVVIRREEDAEKGKKVRGGKAEKAKLAHSGDDTKTLRHTYANCANATRAARSALDKSQRGASTFSLTLARGRPDLFPELPATVRGWKPAIDGADWLIVKVTHRLTPSGLVSELELELGIDDEESGAEDEE